MVHCFGGNETALGMEWVWGVQTQFEREEGKRVMVIRFVSTFAYATGRMRDKSTRNKI